MTLTVGVKTFHMPVFLWRVGVCENLVQIMVGIKLLDYLCTKLGAVIITDLNMNLSGKKYICRLQVVFNYFFPGPFYLQAGHCKTQAPVQGCPVKGVYNSKYVGMPSFTGNLNVFNVHFQNF